MPALPSREVLLRRRRRGGAGGAPSLDHLSVPFGEHTRASAGAWQLTSDGSTALTGAADAGTGSATNVSVSAGGLLTCTVDHAFTGQDGNTVDVTSDQGSFTYTLNVIADTFHCASGLEGHQAMDDTLAKPGGGVTIRFRDGAAGNDDRLAKNNTYTSPITMDADPGATLAGQWTFETVDGLTIDGVHFHNSAQTGSAVIRLHGEMANFVVQDCEIHGVDRDPLGDYSSGSYSNVSGITSISAASGQVGEVTIRRNKIYDVEEGIVLTPTSAGALSITDNEIFFTYEDGVKLAISSSALTSVKTISRNVMYNWVGDPTDTGNPHIDAIQFISSAASNGLDMTNMTIEQNVIWQDTSVARGSAIHGIVAFTDSSSNFIAKDWVVRANVVLVDSANCIALQAVDGGQFVNNSVFRKDDTSTETGIAGISLGSASSAGTVTLTRNLIDEITTAGAATFTETDNVEMGDKGATIAYADALVDETAPTTFATVLSKKARLTGGDADLAGGPPDAGAIGSGAATFGSVRDETGWSVT